MREGKGEKKEEMVGGKGKEMGRGLVSLTKVDVQCYKLDRRLTTVKFISLTERVTQLVARVHLQQLILVLMSRLSVILLTVH